MEKKNKKNELWEHKILSIERLVWEGDLVTGPRMVKINLTLLEENSVLLCSPYFFNLLKQKINQQRPFYGDSFKRYFQIHHFLMSEFSRWKDMK